MPNSALCARVATGPAVGAAMGTPAASGSGSTRSFGLLTVPLGAAAVLLALPVGLRLCTGQRMRFTHSSSGHDSHSHAFRDLKTSVTLSSP